MTRSSRSHLTSASASPIRLLLVLLAVLGLSACTDKPSSNYEPPATTGSASIFLTDAPSDDFDQILVTIERVELRGGGSPVTVFSGSETVDLKELENFSDLFLHADRIPAREYSKIRLAVSRVELVEDEGTPDERRYDADIPANGKIDLNPRSPFEVREGVDCVIEIDIDAKKSIHIVETGRADKYKFRPVVFVTVRDTLAPRKLGRVHGEITEIVDDWNFELCTTRFMATPEPLMSRPESDEGGLGDRHRCIMVELDDATGVFDENGDPIASGELVEGDFATVVGRFHIVDANHDDGAEIQPIDDGAPSLALAGHAFDHREHMPGGGGADSDVRSDKDSRSKSDKDSDSKGGSDSDSDGDRPRPPDVELVLLAYVVELGEPGTFLSLRGEVQSEVIGDEFDFAIAPGQGFGDDSVVSALLQDGTRIFTRGGYEVDESEIAPETLARIDGVFASSSEDPSLLKTALIVLDILPGFEDEVRGDIVEIDRETGRIDVDDEGDDACIDVDEDTVILLLEEGEDGASTSRGDLSDLEVGWHVEAYGDGDGSECLAADVVVAYVEEAEPVVCTVNDDCGEEEFCDKADGACEGEGVCAPKPMLCTLEYDPVCGCDDETYSNACAANGAGTSVAYEGECEPVQVVCGGAAGIECGADEVCLIADGECSADAEGICVARPDACPDVWAPVCGCDGTTYGNACEALAAGATVEYEGECEPEPVVCATSDDCSAGEFCDKPDGICEAEGACAAKPDVCADIYDPVCGCDEMTYPSLCVANALGASVAYEGECKPEEVVCGGIAGDECSAGEVCLYPVGECISDAQGVCIPAPEICPDVWAPVCSCDGTTYGNECEAIRAGAIIDSSGECPNVEPSAE